MREVVYNKAYKFRILPDCVQRILFAKTFGCVRFVWNKMLDYAIAVEDINMRDMSQALKFGKSVFSPNFKP